MRTIFDSGKGERLIKVIFNSKKLSRETKQELLESLAHNAKLYASKLKGKKPMNAETAAASIDKAAVKSEKDAERYWGSKSKSPDPEMVEVGKKDATSLRLVAAILRKGDVKRACNKAELLDTIVREEIPQEAWDFLHGDR